MMRFVVTAAFAALLVLAVALWVAVLVKFTHGTAWYAELKAWQTGLGAFAGLLAILAGALYNARLARRRDDRLRRDEIRGLCLALSAELTVSAKRLRTTVRFVTEAAKEQESLTVDYWKVLNRPVFDVYEANLDKVGLLGELASEVVSTYSTLEIARRYDDRLEEVSEDGSLVDATTINVERRWGDDATKAAELARRLEAYEPPDA